ncbi:MAG TPA: hypothetical protein VM580_32855, partial [Labilithrix sp.]|nr:hypothetical protein [Labilithrix sp.]
MRATRRLGLVVLAVLGAGAPSPMADEAPAEGPSVSVTLLGCDAVADDAPCEVAPGQEIRVLVDGPVATSAVVVATADPTCPTVSAPPSSPSDGLVRIALQGGETAICVGTRGAAAVRLPLVPTRRPAWLREANRARKEGDSATALSLARAHEHDAGIDGVRSMALRGRLALARGDIEDAVRLLGEAVAGHAGKGRLSEEADDRFALAFSLATHAHRFGEAESVLAAEVVPRTAEAQARAAYYRAIVANEAGLPRRALLHLDVAKRELRRLGVEQDLRDAEELSGLVLLRMGRAAEARELFLDLDRRTAATTPPCTRTTRLVNAAIASLSAWANADRPRPSPTFGPEEAERLATEALELGDARCAGGLRHANAALALAEANEALGRLAEARRYLTEAHEAAPEPSRWLSVWGHNVMARVLIAEGKPLSAMREIESVLDPTATPYDVWSLQRTRGLALQRAGRTHDAIMAYAEAEAALDEIASRVPFGEGRASAVSGRRETSRALAALYLAQGGGAKALEVARHARARVLASLVLSGRTERLDAQIRKTVEDALAELRLAEDALDRESQRSWAIPTSELAASAARKSERARAARRALDRALEAAGRLPVELPALAPTDLTLLLEGSGAHPNVMVAFDGKVVAHAPSGTKTIEELLGTNANDLTRARRVRILASGEASSIPVHVLPWGGRPLAEWVPVVYGLDLPRRDVSPGTGTVIVADPTGDLPAARAEAGRVVELVRARGVSPRLFFQRAADLARVRPALEGVATFHFAGHASAGGHD